MKLHSKVAGYYKIEKVTNAGSALEYKEPITDWFPNLILNTGLDRLGTNYFTYNCLLGAGSTAPATTDLYLDSFLGYAGLSVTPVGANSSAPEYYKSVTMTYRFNAGVATGNISEVGIGWLTTSGGLFSRALILDGLGAPTTITKLSDEVLDVTYQFRVYASLLDFIGGFTLTGNKGATYTYTGRVSDVDATMALGSGSHPYPLGDNLTNYLYTGGLAAITEIPTGYINGVNIVLDAYVPGSYKRSGITTFSLAQGNNALGINSITVISRQGTWQFELNTPIMKTSSDTLSLKSEVSWSR